MAACSRSQVRPTGPLPFSHVEYRSGHHVRSGMQVGSLDSSCRHGVGACAERHRPGGLQLADAAAPGRFGEDEAQRRTVHHDVDGAAAFCGDVEVGGVSKRRAQVVVTAIRDMDDQAYSFVDGDEVSSSLSGPTL